MLAVDRRRRRGGDWAEGGVEGSLRGRRRADSRIISWTAEAETSWGGGAVGRIDGVSVLQAQRSQNPQVQVWFWGRGCLGGRGAELGCQVPADSLAELLGGLEVMTAVLERSIVHEHQVPLQLPPAISSELLWGENKTKKRFYQTDSRLMTFIRPTVTWTERLYWSWGRLIFKLTCMMLTSSFICSQTLRGQTSR